MDFIKILAIIFLIIILFITIRITEKYSRIDWYIQCQIDNSRNIQLPNNEEFWKFLFYNTKQ